MSAQWKWVIGIVSIVVIFALLACGIFLAWRYFFAGKPSVVIAAPPSNYQALEGDEVTVEARATGRSIVRVELWVDDGLVDSASSPSPQDTFSAALTWQASGLGSHIVEVRAYDARGQASEAPAAIVVMVATGVAEVTPTITVEPSETPTPTTAPPTATPTSTPEATATPSSPAPTATPTATPTIEPLVIDSFTIDDSTITAGETTYLRWEFHNATESHLYRDDVEIQSGLSSPGNRAVNPVVTRTFKLVVSNAAGSAEASVTLTVTPAVVADPVIHYFKVNDVEGDIAVTEGESVTLKWDTDNAWGGVSLNGAGVVSPGEATETPGVGAHTYTLVADNGAGVEVSLSRTVTVNPAGPTEVTVRVRLKEVYWEDVPVEEKCSALSGGPGWCRMFLRVTVNGLPMKELPGAYPASLFDLVVDGTTSFFNWETDPFTMNSDQPLEITVLGSVNRHYYGAPGPYAPLLIDTATVTYDPVTAGEGDHELWSNHASGWRFRINLVRVTID